MNESKATLSRFKLEDVVQQFMDFRGRTPLKLGMEWGGGDIRALSANNVQMGRIDFRKECYFGSESLYRRWMTKGDCQRGDVLLTTEAPLGNVAQIPDDKRYILSQRTILLKVDTAHADSDYLFHLFQSEPFQAALVQRSTGTTVVGIQQAKLAKLEVDLPSLPEQRKIARILTTLDELIEKTEALIAKYQAIKQGMMHDLFTRGVDEHCHLRPTYDEAPELYKESELGWIPKEWKVRRVSDFAETITSGSRGWATYYSIDGAIFVRIGNLTREHVNFRWDNIQRVQPPKSSEGERTKLQPGDVLVSVTADLGIVAVVPDSMEDAYINQHIALIRLRENTVNPKWLGRNLSGRRGQVQFEKLNDSGAKAGLNLPAVGSLQFADAPQYEQDFTTESLDRLEYQIEVERTALEKCREIKSGLMQDLLTGKVRVKVDERAEDV